MVFSDHFSSALIGKIASVMFMLLLWRICIFNWFLVSCDRDEEKKMGTLVKEDFGRPDRSNTMVSTQFCMVFIF